jgi:hypothetical protein
MTTRIATSLILFLNLLLAFAAGFISIIGFFSRGTISDIGGMLAQWVAVLVGFALLVGLANLVKVHVGRTFKREEGWFYSLVLVGSALAVLALGLIEGGPGHASVAWIFRWVYQPLGAALFSLLAFFLATALFRLPRMRSLEATVLLLVALVVVVGQAPFSAIPPLDVISGIANWVRDYPALAGIRAIILGVAFGAIATSLRVLLGFDRPYME